MALRRIRLCALTLAFLSASGLAQDREESALNDYAAARLSRYVNRCIDFGAVATARAIRLEIVTEYLPNHEETRSALGHVRIGSSWAPTGDADTSLNELAERDRKQLDRAWQQFSGQIASRHLRLAKSLAKNGNDARAAHHFRRTLRFRPTDAEAGRALGRERVNGLWLTPVERDVFLRRIMLQQLVEQLPNTRFPIERIPDDTPAPWLKDELPGQAHRYKGFRGPSAEVWGDLSDRLLREALRAAERCNLLIRALLAGSKGFEWRRNPAPIFILTSERENFFEVVDASGRSSEQTSFIKQYNNGIWLWDNGRQVFFSYESNNLERIVDTIVRCTAGVGPEASVFAIREGLGHVACMLLLGQSLEYFLSLAERQGTASAARRIALAPDTSVWRELAIEQAWLDTGPDAARLALYTSNSMSSDARLKAWSWTYYLLLRDPDLLNELGHARQEGGENMQRIRGAFHERTGIPLRDLERDWRQYWRTIERDPNPWVDTTLDTTTPERNLALWLQQVAERRIQHRVPPFGYVRGLSSDASRVLDLDGARQVLGADRDPMSLDSTEPSSRWTELIVLPRALWETQDGIDQLLPIPGLRDLLLAPGLPVVRYSASAEEAILQVGQLRASGEPVAPVAWPADGAVNVADAVMASGLGAFAPAALGLDNDRGSFGYPISLHFGACEYAIPPQVDCLVEGPDGEIAGKLVGPRPDLPRRLSAPGMYVFYPSDPLPPGAEVRVRWRWRADRAGPQTLRTGFTLR